MNIDQMLNEALFSAALESATNMPEIEVVVYGRVENFERLLDAQTAVSQEQWSIKVLGGQMRVRASYSGDDCWFERCTKTKDEAGRVREFETEITLEEFLLFTTFAERGMIKKRLAFKVDDLTLEVDVFPKPEGGYHEWVKIDIEIEPIVDESVEDTKDRVIELLKNFPDIPFDITDTIVELPEFMGYENKQADKVGKLYDDYFTSKPLRELTVTDHIKIK